MSTKVYSLLGRGFIGIGLLLICALYVGNKYNVASIWQSDEQRFNNAMTEHFNTSVFVAHKKTYKEVEAETFHYAQEICGHFSAGNTDPFFSGTDFGDYLSSVNRNHRDTVFVVSLVGISVVKLCPENESALTSWTGQGLSTVSNSWRN